MSLSEFEKECQYELDERKRIDTLESKTEKESISDEDMAKIDFKSLGFSGGIRHGELCVFSTGSVLENKSNLTHLQLISNNPNEKILSMLG